MANDGKIIIGVSGSDTGYVGDDLNNKGFFATGTALAAAFPSGVDGWYAVIGATDTIWIWDDATTSWIDSGSGFTAGGMLVATYDPTGVQRDAFDMENMNEGTTAKILTATERAKLAGIEAGAQANVLATWEGLPDKPTIPTTTNDITEVTNKRYVTDAQLISIAQMSGSAIKFWTNVLDNEIISAGQSVNYNNILYFCKATYNVGSPKVFNSANYDQEGITGTQDNIVIFGADGKPTDSGINILMALME